MMPKPGKKVRRSGRGSLPGAVFPNDAHLLVRSGKHHLNLKPSEWEPFVVKRALRGNVLPRGYRIVAGLDVGKK
jgi:hypothetical protein